MSCCCSERHFNSIRQSDDRTRRAMWYSKWNAWCTWECRSNSQCNSQFEFEANSSFWHNNSLLLIGYINVFRLKNNILFHQVMGQQATSSTLVGNRNNLVRGRGTFVIQDLLNNLDATVSEEIKVPCPIKCYWCWTEHSGRNAMSFKRNFR
jgi:hypothetical protein